jgi:hypothetical protein
MMRLLHQQNGPNTIKQCVPLNVITMVSPTPMMSKEMVRELRRWTQPPSNYTVDVAASETSVTSSADGTTTASKQMGDCLHYSNNYDDALDDWVRMKQMNHAKNDCFSMIQRFLHRSSISDSILADSVILCVGEDTCDSTIAANGTNESTKIPTTFIHFVSINPESRSLLAFNNSKKNDKMMNLFAIQSMHVSMDTILGKKQTLIQEIRNRLAQLLIEKENEQRIHNENMKLTNSWMDTIKMTMQQFIRKQQQQQYRKQVDTNSFFSWLLRTNEYLPFFDFTTLPLSSREKNGDGDHAVLPQWHTGDLKEIVIPFDFGSTSFGSNRKATLMDTLSSTCHHQLHRSVTGLYRLPSSNVFIRPIPMAKEDRQYCTSPTLIFHSDTEHMDGVLKQNHIIEDNIGATKFMKIGYTGRTSHGQLMISDSSRYGGIHIRLCSQHKPTSMYAEAQDSLLASSLSELQSQRVLLPETDVSTSVDSRTNSTDCWVEFRANLRHPLGFITSSSLLSTAHSDPPKVAKAPNLPYE